MGPATNLSSSLRSVFGEGMAEEKCKWIVK